MRREPEYRRHEHQNLNNVADQGGYITKPRAYHAKQYRHPCSIHGHDDDTGKQQQCLPRDADLESDDDDDNDQHVVEEHDDVPPDHHEIQHCVRKIQLGDETNACRVSPTALGNKCGRKSPGYHTSAQERQIGAHIGLE